MNTYKVTVKGNDILGIQWLRNIVKIANMGGVIEERFHIKTTFPHEVTMLLETENELRLETDMKEGIVVYPVMVAKTKEEMDEMHWDDFKRECRTWGIAGRHRETMLNLYLRATDQEKGVKKVDASPKEKPQKAPKKPKQPKKTSAKGQPSVKEEPSGKKEEKEVVEEVPVQEQPAKEQPPVKEESPAKESTPKEDTNTEE